MTALGPPTPDSAALYMATAWMGSHYYRTFRLVSETHEHFDAMMMQRERLIGVTIGYLWDENASTIDHEFASLLAADAENDASYAVWLPPGAVIPTDEPARSQLRVLLTNGMSDLEPGERREVRIPVTLKLAKIQEDGAYISVTGELSSAWTTMSDGIKGSFHLDSRPIHRLPEEPAELEIILSRIRDRASMLNLEEFTEVHVHDYWLVSRLPSNGLTGVTIIGAPPELDPKDGVPVRQSFRRAINRSIKQQKTGTSDLSVLVLIGALSHIDDELVTAALKGMNPATYGSLDLIVLVADGTVRQILQPRSLPWEQTQIPT